MSDSVHRHPFKSTWDSPTRSSPPEPKTRNLPKIDVPARASVSRISPGTKSSSWSSHSRPPLPISGTYKETAERSLKEELDDRDRTISRLVKVLERREEDVYARDDRISALVQQLGTTVDESAHQEGMIQMLGQRLSDEIRRREKAEAFVLELSSERESRQDNTRARGNSDGKLTREEQLVKEEYEQRIAILTDRLSECNAQLVASRSGRKSSRDSPLNPADFEAYLKFTEYAQLSRRYRDGERQTFQ